MFSNETTWEFWLGRLGLGGPTREICRPCSTLDPSDGCHWGPVYPADCKCALCWRARLSTPAWQAMGSGLQGEPETMNDIRWDTLLHNAGIEADTWLCLGCGAATCHPDPIRQTRCRCAWCWRDRDYSPDMGYTPPGPPARLPRMTREANRLATLIRDAGVEPPAALGPARRIQEHPSDAPFCSVCLSPCAECQCPGDCPCPALQIGSCLGPQEGVGHVHVVLGPGGATALVTVDGQGHILLGGER